MNNIAIYGFGGFGREVACLINQINKVDPRWNLLGFFDDNVAIGTSNVYGKVIGGMNELNNFSSSLSVVLAIANPSIIISLKENIINNNILFPNIIAPNINFFDKESFVIGQGNIITFDNRFSCNVKIGNFNIINGCCSFGHDVEIGNFNIFQPEVRISGETKIGSGNFFGVRSLVLQQIKIGDNTRIGTSSVVIRKTRDNEMYYGNPAKRIKNI